MENAGLWMDREFLNETRALLRDRATDPVDAYRVIDAPKAPFTIARSPRLPAVSRSGHHPQRVREKTITKASGKVRRLGIPTTALAGSGLALTHPGCQLGAVVAHADHYPT